MHTSMDHEANMTEGECSSIRTGILPANVDDWRFSDEADAEPKRHAEWSGASAVAVVHDLASGHYTAYVITVVCGG